MRRDPSPTILLRQALAEDHARHDVTTLAVPGASSTRLTAHLISKADGVLCGAALINPLFSLAGSKAHIRINKKDGTRLRPYDTVAKIVAPATILLGVERVMLNLICRLSGIATMTDAYVQAVRGTKAKILDTRKTTPLWRDLEKYAVRCGGGENHRFSLADAALVKDNHHRLLRAAGLTVEHVYGPGSAFRKRNGNLKFLEIEATNLREVWEALKAKPDIILLDNMPVNRLKTAIAFIHAARDAMNSPAPAVEISGGVSLKNVRALAELGVERISVGALTHSSPAMDFSLEVL